MWVLGSKGRLLCMHDKLFTDWAFSSAQNILYKTQLVNSLSSIGHSVRVTAAQLCHCNNTAVTDKNVIKWTWPHSIKTLFMDTEIWISKKFEYFKNISLSLIFKNLCRNVKTNFCMWAVEKQEGGWIWPTGLWLPTLAQCQIMHPNAPKKTSPPTQGPGLCGLLAVCRVGLGFMYTSSK